MEIYLKIENCMDCPHHEVQPDPDPHDWFNDDDVKVTCKQISDKVITNACRPHHKRVECDIPNWCPLSKKR